MTTENIKNRVWENEGKTYGFVDKETGYSCFIYRHPRYGHLCGYVGMTNPDLKAAFLDIFESKRSRERSIRLSSGQLGKY